MTVIYDEICMFSMQNLVIVKPLVEFNLWMHYLYTIYSYASKQNLFKFFIRDN